MLARAYSSAFLKNQASQLTIDQEEQVDRLCPFGMPKSLSSWDHGRTEYVVRDGYALAFSSTYKVPLWVCERIEKHHLDGSFPRKDKFLEDPQLTGPHPTLKDYRLSGYARGHNAPAENFAWSEHLLAESFYLSNMSPQVGPFNSGAWRKLESVARNSSANHRETWIVTGSLIYDSKEESADTADGWIPYSVIGSNVAVPTHLFKIVVYLDHDGITQATAYVLPNAKPPMGYSLGNYIRPIQWLEQRSGFDYLPDLSPEDSQRIEERPGNSLEP